MSIRYRFKRSSGPVHEPIPAHPDAIYRPQNRPIPVNVPPTDSDAIVQRVMTDNPALAAPLAAGESGFSPWWIIGPLLALLAVMAVGALAYTMKKKQDSKQEAEEENNPRKRETNDRKTNKNKEHDDSARKLPVDNVLLRSSKPDTPFKILKTTIPMLSSAKGNSTSNTNPFIFNEVNNEQFGKSSLPIHVLPLTSDNIAFDESLMNLDRIDNNEQSKTGQNNTEKPKSDANLNEKENQLTNFKKAHDGKSLSGESSINPGRDDHNEPSKGGQSSKKYTSPSSHSETNVQNTVNKSDGGNGHIKQLDSRKQHGIGKSPLISSIPTGSKRSGSEKSQTRSKQNQTEKENSSSESSSSNPKQQQNSPKENLSSSSDINKDEHPSTLAIHSKHDPLSEPRNEKNSTSSHQNEKSSKHNVQPSDQYTMLPKNDLDKFSNRHTDSFTKGLDSNPSHNHLRSHTNSSNPQKFTKSNDDKSDESNTSLAQSNLTNRNKRTSLMPNVPQCKTNTSSDDDDYDEVYLIRPLQQTP